MSTITSNQAKVLAGARFSLISRATRNIASRKPAMEKISAQMLSARNWPMKSRTSAIMVGAETRVGEGGGKDALKKTLNFVR